MLRTTPMDSEDSLEDTQRPAINGRTLLACARTYVLYVCAVGGEARVRRMAQLWSVFVVVFCGLAARELACQGVLQGTSDYLRFVCAGKPTSTSPRPKPFQRTV